MLFKPLVAAFLVAGVIAMPTKTGTKVESGSVDKNFYIPPPGSVPGHSGHEVAEAVEKRDDLKRPPSPVCSPQRCLPGDPVGPMEKREPNDLVKFYIPRAENSAEKRDDSIPPPVCKATICPAEKVDEEVVEKREPKSSDSDFYIPPPGDVHRRPPTEATEAEDVEKRDDQKTCHNWPYFNCHAVESKDKVEKREPKSSDADFYIPPPGVINGRPPKEATEAAAVKKRDDEEETCSDWPYFNCHAVEANNDVEKREPNDLVKFYIP